MHYAVWATDNPGVLGVRQQTREAHRARLRDPGAHPVKVIHGGPTLGEADDTMNGSMLVIEADNIEAVRRFVAEDPYTLANVYAHVEIRAWQWGIGLPSNSAG